MVLELRVREERQERRQVWPSACHIGGGRRRRKPRKENSVSVNRLTTRLRNAHCGEVEMVGQFLISSTKQTAH